MSQHWANEAGPPITSATEIQPGDFVAPLANFRGIDYQVDSVEGEELRIVNANGVTGLIPVSHFRRSRPAVCDCVEDCRACSLSGEPHVHPEWPCAVHPDAPGDHAAPSPRRTTEWTR